MNLSSFSKITSIKEICNLLIKKPRRLIQYHISNFAIKHTKHLANDGLEKHDEDKEERKKDLS